MNPSPQNPESPSEPRTVNTTIVGGRPPGKGRAVGAIPRGIEVLVKKASVDAAFRALLLEKRSAAAETIGLALTAPEKAMLDAAPADQLDGIIASTRVPLFQRPVFLGTAASLMLAAMGLAQVGLDYAEAATSKGIRPDQMPPTTQNEARPTAPAGVAGLVTTPAPAPSDRVAPAGSRPPARPPATQPATQPAPRVTRGISPDVPATQPATQPATATIEDRVRVLVRKLSHDDYGVRENATRELVEMGRDILPILDRVAAEDAEGQMRIALVRERLDPKPIPPPEHRPEEIIRIGLDVAGIRGE